MAPPALVVVVVGLVVVVALVVVVTPSTIGKSFPEVTVVVVAPVVVVPPSTIGKSEVHFTFKQQKNNLTKWNFNRCAGSSSRLNCGVPDKDTCRISGLDDTSHFLFGFRDR